METIDKKRFSPTKLDYKLMLCRQMTLLQQALKCGKWYIAVQRADAVAELSSIVGMMEATEEQEKQVKQASLDD